MVRLSSSSSSKSLSWPSSLSLSLPLFLQTDTVVATAPQAPQGQEAPAAAPADIDMEAEAEAEVSETEEEEEEQETPFSRNGPFARGVHARIATDRISQPCKARAGRNFAFSRLSCSIPVDADSACTLARIVHRSVPDARGGRCLLELVPRESSASGRRRSKSPRSASSLRIDWYLTVRGPARFFPSSSAAKGPAAGGPAGEAAAEGPGGPEEQQEQEPQPGRVLTSVRIRSVPALARFLNGGAEAPAFYQDKKQQQQQQRSGSGSISSDREQLAFFRQAPRTRQQTHRAASCRPRPFRPASASLCCIALTDLCRQLIRDVDPSAHFFSL